MSIFALVAAMGFFQRLEVILCPRPGRFLGIFLPWSGRVPVVLLGFLFVEVKPEAKTVLTVALLSLSIHS
jgi:hypothetical protein